jgi:Flp pilus assembly protein TadG
MQYQRFRRSQRGSALILGIATIIMGMSLGVLAIDVPVYLNARTQLQNATDAAALAGAYALPNGETPAEEAALELLAENPVAGNLVDPDDVDIVPTPTSFQVTAEATAPTIINRLLCALKGGATVNEGGGGGTEGGTSALASCSTFLVRTTSRAEPVARDTMLVIDTSTSMRDLGNNQPFNDVKTAANAYVDKIISLNSNSVDRIGVVSFDRGSALRRGLTSQQQSANFASVKTTINGLPIYSGSGWNTNFETGLKRALDEIQANARKYSDKTIVFMTDGHANTPETTPKWSTCTGHWNNAVYYGSRTVTKRINGRNQQVNNVDYSIANSNYYYEQCRLCAESYVSKMVTSTQTQADRAEAMGVRIHVIQIGGEDDKPTGAPATIKRYLQNPDWESGLQEYIRAAGDGQYYAAENYESNRIREIYEEVAADVRMKLVNP